MRRAHPVAARAARRVRSPSREARAQRADRHDVRRDSRCGGSGHLRQQDQARGKGQGAGGQQGRGRLWQAQQGGDGQAAHQVRQGGAGRGHTSAHRVLGWRAEGRSARPDHAPQRPEQDCCCVRVRAAFLLCASRGGGVAVNTAIWPLWAVSHRSCGAQGACGALCPASETRLSTLRRPPAPRPRAGVLAAALRLTRAA